MHGENTMGSSRKMQCKRNAILVASKTQMRHLFKLLSLLAVLIVAQQGAVVHELSHVFRASHSEGKAATAGFADTTCAQCPAFAQVVTPAFSHSFHVPLLVRITAERVTELEIAAIDAAVPHPRSRGPPSLR